MLNQIKYKILNIFYGLEGKVLDTEKKYSSGSTFIFLLFPVIFSFGFYYLIFISAREILIDFHWSVCAIFSFLPFYAFYSLISFSYISWKYGKERGDKITNLITMILRSFIQVFIVFFIASLITVQIDSSLAAGEIEKRKSLLVNTFKNQEKRNINELLRENRNKYDNVVDLISINNENALKPSLRKVEKQYYTNVLEKLNLRKDSLSLILANAEKKLNKQSQERIKSYTNSLQENTFYFVRFISALTENSFFVLAVILTTLVIMFNISYYRRFLSVESDYFNIDILLQEKLLDQQAKPVADHTSKFLLDKFNYKYSPPLSEQEIKLLKKKQREFKNKEDFIEILKNGSKNKNT